LLYRCLIRSIYLWSRLAKGGILHREYIITIAWLSIATASAPIPLAYSLNTISRVTWACFVMGSYVPYVLEPLS
jgi:hypothetical protein